MVTLLGYMDRLRGGMRGNMRVDVLTSCVAGLPGRHGAFQGDE